LPEVAGALAARLAPDDEAGLADAVARLLDPGAAAEEASRSGLERARQFGAERFARGMDQVYRRAVDAKAPRGTQSP
jgi:hypothetical protein